MTAPVTPRCPHFGPCGGCQYQSSAYEDQLGLKHDLLAEILEAAGLANPPEIQLHSAEPWLYRNRIRLRVGCVEGDLRLGYNHAETNDFLPITTCPIAAPILWQTAEALLATAVKDRDTGAWLDAAAQVEFFCDDTATRVQMTLLCNARRIPSSQTSASFDRSQQALEAVAPQVVSSAAVAFDPRTAQTGRTLTTHGATGLAYRVGDENYWITRGGFFQVNRFLLETLVQLVYIDNGRPRSGQLAWDLFAGVGLFSRVLARQFASITAVEANPTAAADLRSALARLGRSHIAVPSTTLDFLRSAVLQRDRPDLIVLDPPRAGAGVEACDLLTRIAAQEIVYVSCDPTTLARDLAALQATYRVTALHLVDLFPQTSHLETVATLQRTG